MKRLLCVILLLTLVLSGCSLGLEQTKEPVIFYYMRQHTGEDAYDAFFSEGVIGQEIREASGHRSDLQYLLALYMQGPNDPDLQFPFPVGSKVMETRIEDGKLIIVMNAISSRFDELDVTVSCACIAKTCMELVDVEEVTVMSCAPGNQILFTRTFTPDNLILADTHTLPAEPAEETE